MKNIYAMHRTALSFLLFFSLGGAALNAQWNQIASFPAGGTDASFSFVIDDVAYVGGGLLSSRLFAYDMEGGWSDRGPLPGGVKRPWAYGFTYNGKGYMGGGALNGTEVASDFYEYDPATNRWTPLAPFGGGPRDGCFSFVIGDKAYVGGGFDGTYILFDTWEYSFSENTWTRVGDYGGGSVLFASSFILNDKAYVVGGAGQTEYPWLFEFNPQTKGWVRRADFPGTPRQAGAAFALHGRGYYGAGMAGYAITFQDFWAYDPESDAWTKVEERYPDELSAWVVGFVLGDKAYVGTGAGFVDQQLTVTDGFYSFSENVNSVADRTTINAGMRVVPNPTTDLITLSFSLSRDEEVEIAIIDMLGRRVSSSIRSMKEGMGREEIDLSGLAAGSYFIQVSSDEESRRTTVIKLP